VTQNAHFEPAETAVFEKACVAGSERGCWAMHVWSGPVLREACLAGVMTGCHPWDPRDGKVSTETREEAEFACEHGVAEDCTTLGNASTLATAARDYERACPPFASKDHERDVDLAGCAKLGQALREGRGVAVDRRRALELLTRACFGKRIVHGVADACVTLAQMLDAGEGVPADPSAATQAIAMACSLEPSTCDALAKRVESGVGIERDPEHARRLYKTACKNGTTLACIHGGDATPIDLGGFR
jgi:hypothetical protein